ncbi:MAG TPA: peptide chain release factor N(5)-glutamine methyltransferase [Stellaceae bacterium]|nr:peptide chain release factor N(5)-glutamine methyltransferase [Stellaceae bacterium]
MSATLGEAMARAASDLAAAGVPESRREARLLVALAAGVETASVLIHPEFALEEAAAVRLAEMVRRRRTREPVSRLIGRREFWSLEFEVGAATLDPRPDSETLVESALARIPDRTRGLRVLDLGTGTGCLLLALLSELPNATGLGLDLASGAVAVARRNAAANRLEARAFFAVGSWGAAAGGGFDVVLANPPYVPTAEIAHLAPEVAQWEPRLALDGGADGLGAYRTLAPDLVRLVAPTGFAVIELGAGQADEASAIFRAAGLDVVARGHDLAGLERCLVLAKSKKTLEKPALPV